MFLYKVQDRKGNTVYYGSMNEDLPSFIANLLFLAKFSGVDSNGHASASSCLIRITE